MELQKKFYNFILAYWKLIKKYTPPPKQSDDCWDVLAEEATQLSKQYEDGSKESKLFTKLIVDWLNYLGEYEK